MADDDESNKLSAHKCSTAAKEVAGALTLVAKRSKPSDDFALAQFLADTSQLLGTAIETSEEWERIRVEAKEKRQAIRSTKTPWELIEIDRSHFDPRARDILNDPFFWEAANDLAPNGNDTGADLLADYQRWDKRHRRRSPMVFLAQLLAEWNIKPIDWSITDKVMVRSLDKERPIDLRLCNEAIIALAFAVIKMRGACPTDIISMALAAITRTAILVTNSSMGTETKASWDRAITKMKGKLESLLR